ncbi:Serpentine receptor class delta-50 [Caenorhabditis elegans]|uniref:Serpentine receptor class delta-50 n=1 Tax=Caenorhabditis elegans TaxID=6239 RepID=UPI00077FE506|nr:Serpentine receptor class delta-50 [Caenorhabditis elegans]CAA94133.3 Serpentine receptor class delta-50 [Caenorhabditis elegans]|eukprot:NP_001309446.1 Serpentine receptor class delta-50 [Caenorhabditis elegans]
MMSAMETNMVLILTIFYNAYFLLAISSQLLLLYLMLKCQNRSLHEMRIYLFNILGLQFISTFSAFVLQCRIVPSSGTVAMLCYGPCKYLGNIVCEVLFHILQTSLIACATALIIAFYYRYEMLTNNSFTRSGHYKQLVISYCVPLVFLICEVLSPNDVNKLVAELTVLHPTYGLENYAILGFSDVKTVAASSQTLMLMIGLYGTPFIALVFRKKIIKILHSSRSYHAEKIVQTKSMIQGLTLQTLLPLICYCPGFTYYIYSQYTQSSSLFVEFAVSPYGFVYTIFDPLLTIYYVLPYRRTFKAIFSKHNSTTSATFVHSETARRVA